MLHLALSMRVVKRAVTMSTSKCPLPLTKSLRFISEMIWNLLMRATGSLNQVNDHHASVAIWWRVVSVID